MENPRTINRFLIALLIAFTAAAVAASIYFHNAFILFGWLATVAAFFLFCLVFALLNIAVFAPLFSLLARLDAKFAGRRPHDR
jgi:ABC-type thiamin/hydroxymethylpyrimidine transport system permease subunit